MNYLKYLGHSCFQFSIGGKTIIIDPFIRENALADGKVDVGNLEADFILLTHGHGDHVADAEELSLRNGATIISNFEVANWFQDRGCTTFGMNTGGKNDFGFGEVRMVKAVHSSSLPDGSYGGNPTGFLIHADGVTLYFAGDTALTKDMELIPSFYHKPDLAILPVGGCFTMDYEDALIASKLLQCDRVIGCHFNTFPPISIDTVVAEELFAKNGKELILPEINQVINL
ncbi:MAG TPA: metal-dependent hydrolase [Saprospiraceae bacterium]|jgi:L-ascorbate metabolism protein UlaG (beta-lactamase superfamily)|nr:MAG: beta-lactamase domain-containing protein [Candidatus Parvibacillus calidus]MBX2936173.1 metal-dependent hydrolase [Saprospiraceae bacterium]MBX7179100.1 metal-dependent hydrolase [Saprospiraceae bacterium]MCB0589875.1 metal-dependent hydrolase [Saprospiraceae bacterium]MCC7148612.1 metal-dependent hydrolase [Saprospiraceae bacterium]